MSPEMMVALATAIFLWSTFGLALYTRFIRRIGDPPFSRWKWVGIAIRCLLSGPLSWVITFFFLIEWMRGDFEDVR